MFYYSVTFLSFFCMFVPGLKIELRILLLAIGAVCLIFQLVQQEKAKVSRIRKMIEQAKKVGEENYAVTIGECVGSSKQMHSSLEGVKMCVFLVENGEEMIFITEDNRFFNTIKENLNRRIRIHHYQNVIIDIKFE